MDQTLEPPSGASLVFGVAQIKILICKLLAHFACVARRGPPISNVGV